MIIFRGIKSGPVAFVEIFSLKPYFTTETNELNYELPPERIAKSIIDVAKNTQSDSRIVSLSGIVPRNNNEVNKELSKMCGKENYFS